MNVPRNPMRNTKIGCTIGPASESVEVLEELVNCGSEMTAQRISRHRPSHPIIALSFNEETIKRLGLSWGAIPVKGGHIQGHRRYD